jgi:hypothetical protein
MKILASIHLQLGTIIKWVAKQVWYPETNNTSTANNSLIGGIGNTVSANNAFTVGENNTINQVRSGAIGYGNVLNAGDSFVLGIRM